MEPGLNRVNYAAMSHGSTARYYGEDDDCNECDGGYGHGDYGYDDYGHGGHHSIDPRQYSLICRLMNKYKEAMNNTNIQNAWLMGRMGMMFSSNGLNGMSNNPLAMMMGGNPMMSNYGGSMPNPVWAGIAQQAMLGNPQDRSGSPFNNTYM